jgi:hypothetical protein
MKDLIILTQSSNVPPSILSTPALWLLLIFCIENNDSRTWSKGTIDASLTKSAFGFFFPFCMTKSQSGLRIIE